MPKRSPRAAKKPAVPAITPEQKREIAALEARIAQIRRQPVTRSQERDLTWWRKTQRESIVADYVASMPKGDYCTLAGRQHKTIDDCARNHDLPLDGPTVDLGEVLRALHDLVASKNNRNPDLEDSSREELEEEKLRQQIQKLELENDRLRVVLSLDRGDAINRRELRDALTAVAASMRDTGRALERVSPAARDVYNQMLDSLAEEIESGRLAF